MTLCVRLMTVVTPITGRVTLIITLTTRTTQSKTKD